MKASVRNSGGLIVALALLLITGGCTGMIYPTAPPSTAAPATDATTPMESAAAESPSAAPASPDPVVSETGAATADASPAAEPSPGAPEPAPSATEAPAEVVSPTTGAAPASVEPSSSTDMAGADTSAAAAPAPEPVSLEQGVFYRDDFTDPGSGWPDNVEFGSYYIGYHEPNHYHVEVHTPHDRALVAVPERSFSDATIEAPALAEPNNTAKTGDFRYGLFFHRSGNQFYAFAVSPRTKTWSVFKSSPNGLTELAKGSNDAIQGLTAEDRLRVDVKGSQFFFHVDDQIVGEVSDSDYGSGEAGFYLETFDSPRVHIHYGTITIREAAPPQLQCTVNTRALRLRLGPGTAYPIITYLPAGVLLVPIARSPNGLWIQVRREGSDETGWVASSPELVTCSIPMDSLPELPQ